MFETNLNIADEWDKARWDSFVMSFYKSNRQSFQNYIALAHYAAFPIILNTDLVYKIFLNFIKPTLDNEGEYPIWQASEFLFSPIIREIGYDLYEIYPEIRESLKSALSKTKINKDTKDTENIRMANFMKEYIEKCRDKIPTEAIYKAQELNYKVELDPLEAIKEVFRIIRESNGKIQDNHIAYLLAYGKKRIEGATQTASGLAKVFDDIDELYKNIQSNNTKNIVKSLKNFDIKENATGFQVPIPTEAYERLEINKIEKNKARKRSFKLKIYINHYNGSLQIVQNLIDKIKNSDAQIAITKQEKYADYTLHIRNEKVYITHPNEIYRPLIEPFGLSHSNMIDNVVYAFKYISNWHSIKNLKGDLNTKEKPIEINGKPKAIKDVITFNYLLTDKQLRDAFRITVTNVTTKTYFVHIISFGYDFKISNEEFNLSAFNLGPGLYTEISYSPTVMKDKISLDNLISEYNWHSKQIHLKLILTEKQIETPYFSQSLPKPFTLEDRHSETMDFLEIEPTKLNLTNFITQDIVLKFINPQFNQISKNTLREMLTFDKMSDFALGIYYNVVKDRLLRPIYTLKPEIRLIDESH